MDIKLVKEFLKIDYDDEDNYIEFLIQVAKEYIKNSVTVYDETRALIRMLILAIVSDLYRNRAYTIDEKEEKSYVIKSILLQLQLEEGV